MSSTSWTRALVVIYLAGSFVRAGPGTGRSKERAGSSTSGCTGCHLQQERPNHLSGRALFLSQVLAELSLGANIPIVVSDALAQESVEIKLDEAA